MKETFARTILCAAVLAFASVTLLAQTVPGVVTINGGENTVPLHVSSPSAMQEDVEPDPLVPFYSDFVAGGVPYNCGKGYSVSEAGSPLGVELTPAAQFKSAKTGNTRSVTVAVGWIAGINGIRVTLDNDCGNKPCGGPDGPGLCRSTIKGLPNFGTMCMKVEKLHCVAALVAGRMYWVYIEAPSNNTLERWNLSGTPTLGRMARSKNDGAWVVRVGIALAAFSVQ